MNYVGVDIAKAKFDVFMQGTTKVYTNDEKGIQSFIKGLPEDAFVLFEATGVYSRLFHKRLCESGARVARVNPYKSRQFAKASGFLAKTDTVDARMLALYGEKIEQKETTYPDDHQEKLEELVYAKKALEKELGALTNRLEKTFFCAVAEKALRSTIDHIQENIAMLDTEIKTLVKDDAVYAKKVTLLCSIPGIAFATAVSLLCYCPELGTFSSKQVTALAGLAPTTCQSGTCRGREMISGGRCALREALYWPAITSARFNKRMVDLYTRLKARGKPSKVAIVAVMRKQLIYANAVLKTQQAFRR